MWNQGCRGISSTVVLMTGYRRKENKSEMSFGDCCRNFISEIWQADGISTQRQCCPLQEELLAWAWSPAVQSHWLEVDRSMFKRRKNPKWSFHSLLATLYPGMMRTTGWWNNPWNEHGGGAADPCVWHHPVTLEVPVTTKDAQSQAHLRVSSTTVFQWHRASLLEKGVRNLRWGREPPRRS